MAEAHENLRAFEDANLGADAPRHDGKVEKGHGSLYQSKLSPDEKRVHSLLEQAIDADSDIQEAKTNLLEAEQALAEIEAKINAAQEKAAAAPADPARATAVQVRGRGRGRAE